MSQFDDKEQDESVHVEDMSDHPRQTENEEGDESHNDLCPNSIDQVMTLTHKWVLITWNNILLEHKTGVKSQPKRLGDYVTDLH